MENGNCEKYSESVVPAIALHSLRTGENILVLTTTPVSKPVIHEKKKGFSFINRIINSRNPFIHFTHLPSVHRCIIATDAIRLNAPSTPQECAPERKSNVWVQADRHRPRLSCSPLLPL